jgi:hypothetical protein
MGISFVELDATDARRNVPDAASAAPRQSDAVLTLMARSRLGGDDEWV